MTFYLTSDDASKLYINGVLVGSDPGAGRVSLRLCVYGQRMRVRFDGNTPSA